MMSFIQDRLGADFGSKIAFVSITVDPERDSPQVLREYGEERYANRIAGASFVIDGTRYALSANDGRNHVHGGSRGFDRAVWTMHPIPGANGVALSLVSPDGEQGYPGRLAVHLDILLEGLGELVFRYRARTDRPTHVNLTSHCYFNLGGSSAVS